MDFGPFGATPPGPAPRGYIKILNVFLQASSIGLSPELKRSRSNGVTLQMDRKMNGWKGEGEGGKSQYPHFFFEKHRDNYTNFFILIN